MAKITGLAEGVNYRGPLSNNTPLTKLTSPRSKAVTFSQVGWATFILIGSPIDVLPGVSVVCFSFVSYS
ncbi:hypothetical protein [Candidatus Aquicultor sp.]